jgi:hypothetical protein
MASLLPVGRMPRSPGHDADPRVVALERLLRHYWRRNPLACDTLDGIAQWWLPEGHGATSAEVLGALERMEDEGLVEEVVGGDGRTHYRLREEVAGELRRLDIDESPPFGELH